MLISIKNQEIWLVVGSDKPRMLFSLFKNVKMPTIIGILTFISRKNFMLIWVEHEKNFYNLGAWCGCYCDVVIVVNICNFWVWVVGVGVLVWGGGWGCGGCVTCCRLKVTVRLNRYRDWLSEIMSYVPISRPKVDVLFWFFGDFRCGMLLFTVILVIYKYKNR